MNDNKEVVEVENGKIIREWRSVRKAGKELLTSRQTIINYCKNRTKKKMFNLMYKEDFLKEQNEIIQQK